MDVPDRAASKVPGRQPLPARLLAPWHWPAWLAMGGIWLIGHLPWPVGLAWGGALGTPLRKLLRGRRRVAQRNLELCFPDLDAQSRECLLREHFRDLGRMFMEFALTWTAPDRRFGALPHAIEGIEHLHAAQAGGRGVLLVGAHFGHMELCARLIARRLPMAGLYREHGSPVFEWAIKRLRMRYAQAMYGRRELRACVRHLKRGGVLWYAPDQDMRGKDSVFAPFLGVLASTITATHHLARMSGADVILFKHHRLPGRGGYRIELSPPLADFPSEDPVADSARINVELEPLIRSAPTQYLWLHKRFKTRPPGEPPIYR